MTDPALLLPDCHNSAESINRVRLTRICRLWFTV